jgi:hypothetical protein
MNKVVEVVKAGGLEAVKEMLELDRSQPVSKRIGKSEVEGGCRV